MVAMFIFMGEFRIQYGHGVRRLSNGPIDIGELRGSLAMVQHLCLCGFCGGMRFESCHGGNDWKYGVA
jgi:hypothetical protein